MIAPQSITRRHERSRRGWQSISLMSQNCDLLSFTDFRNKTEFSDLEDLKTLAKPTLFRLQTREPFMASPLPKAEAELMSSGLTK
jgi:hypothetical protein